MCRITVGEGYSYVVSLYLTTFFSLHVMEGDVYKSYEWRPLSNTGFFYLHKQIPSDTSYKITWVRDFNPITGC